MTDKDIKIEIKAESAKASAEIKKLTKQIDTMNKRIKTGSRANVGEVGQMTRSFKSLTAHVSKLALIYGSFKTLMTGTVITAKFEESIKKLGIYSGASAEEIGALEDKAKSLGESTVFSASQVAEGMNEMALAGLSSDDMLAGIGDTLNLASVGMISLKDATDYTVTAMKTFGLQATDMNDITDIFAKGSTISATTVTQLGQAMTKVGAVSASFGTSLQETTALLGILADGGRRGTEAGTQLKIAMLRLASNPEAKKYITSLTDATTGMALSMYDAQGKLLPFTTQLQKIRDALKGLDAEARNEVMARIFGTEAVASAEILMKNLEKVHENLAKISHAMETDFATSSAKAIVDTLIGSFKNLQSALEGLAIKIVGEMTPALREMLDSWTETIRGMDEDEVKDFADALVNLIDGVTAVTGAFTSIAGATIGFISDNKNLTGAIIILTGALKVLKIELVATFVTALTTGGAGITRFTGLMIVARLKAKAWLTAMTAGMGLVTAGLSVLVLGTMAYIDHLERQNKLASKTADTALQSADSYAKLGETLTDAYDQVTDSIGKSNAERLELAKSIGEELVALQKEEKAMKQGSLDTETYANMQKVLADKKEMLIGWLKKLAESRQRETTALEGATKAEVANSKASEDAIKAFDKYDKALQKKVKGHIKAVETILKAESGLLLKQAQIEADKFSIINKYADMRSQILEDYDKLEYEGRTANLNSLKKYEADKLRIAKLLLEADKALSAGRTEEASRFYAEAKSMASSFSGQIIEENGAMLVSATDTYQTASDVYKKTKKGELAILNQKKIAELEANKEKLELVALELKGQQLLLNVQAEFLNQLGKLGDKAKETKDKFDQPDYLEKINKEYDETLAKFDGKILSIQTDIDKKKFDSKMQSIQGKTDALGNPIKLSVDTDDIDLAEQKTYHIEKRMQTIDGMTSEVWVTVEDADVDEAIDGVNDLKDATEGWTTSVDIDMTDIDEAKNKVELLKDGTEVITLDFTTNDASLDGAKEKLNTLVMGDYKVRVDADTTPADFGINRFIQTWKTDQTDGTKKIMLELSPEWKKAERIIEQFRKNQGKKPIKTDLEVDTGTVDADIKKAETKIENSPPAEMEVTADTNPAVSEAERATGVINSLNPVIKIQVDASAPLAMIAQLKKPTSSIHTIIEKRIPASANGGRIPQHLASGGTFTGSGSVGGYDPTDSDSVNAKLTGGEYVIKREAVDFAGVSLLDAINNMNIPRPRGYADGGVVGGVVGAGVSRNISLNFMGDDGSPMQTMTDEQTAQKIENYFRKYAQ